MQTQHRNANLAVSQWAKHKMFINITKRIIGFIWHLNNGQFIMFEMKKTNALESIEKYVKTFTPT